MQYRVYDRQQLKYIDGGYVVNYTIDDDYIVNNNSTISIVQPTSAEVGDIVCLIKTRGAYHKGVITEVDNSALKISYKADKELFNDNILNPMRSEFKDGVKIAGKFGLPIVASIIESTWVQSRDTLKRLPLTIVITGDVVDEQGNPKMLWTWDNISVNFADWLVELFEKYNVVLDWSIDFDTSKDIRAVKIQQNIDFEEALDIMFAQRQPKYIIYLTAMKGGNPNIIKDNVAMQTITYTGEELPEATVCYVIDSESKDLLIDSESEKPAVYYLAQENGKYRVTLDTADINRMLPVRTTIIEYKDESKNETGESENGTEVVNKYVTPRDSAEDTLLPSQYNQAVEVVISNSSKMFDWDLARFGSEYTIVNKNGTINSNYTGRKETSENNLVTLYFGLGRKNYTDLIQMRMRKQRYTKTYNQG